jgi:hypothetical protein
MTKNTKILGALCAIGNGIWFVDGLIWVLTRGEFNALHQITWDIGVAGGICGIAGLILLRATGSHIINRLLTCLPILAMLLYIASSFAGPNAGAAIPFIAWALQLAGMLVAGILALITKGWGWRKVTPLLTVLIVPAAMFTLGPLHLSGALPTSQAVAWTLMGYAVLSGAPLAAAAPAAALRQGAA